MKPFREHEQTRADVIAMLRYSPWDLLEAAAEEAEEASEPRIAKMLRNDAKALRGAVPDDETLTIGEILKLFRTWRFRGNQSPWAFTPGDVRVICESLFIDTFELYRVRNHCEYGDILRKFN